jgi:hypothetical protein
MEETLNEYPAPQWNQNDWRNQKFPTWAKITARTIIEYKGRERNDWVLEEGVVVQVHGFMQSMKGNVSTLQVIDPYGTAVDFHPARLVPATAYREYRAAIIKFYEQDPNAGIF